MLKENSQREKTLVAFHYNIESEFKREREREREEEDIDQKQFLGVILSALNEDEKINFQAGDRQTQNLRERERERRRTLIRSSSWVLFCQL
jgi:hypothetical protein